MFESSESQSFSATAQNTSSGFLQNVGASNPLPDGSTTRDEDGEEGEGVDIGNLLDEEANQQPSSTKRLLSSLMVSLDMDDLHFCFINYINLACIIFSRCRAILPLNPLACFLPPRTSLPQTFQRLKGSLWNLPCSSCTSPRYIPSIFRVIHLLSYLDILIFFIIKKSLEW